jgi:hypothetical protein
MSGGSLDAYDTALYLGALILTALLILAGKSPELAAVPPFIVWVIRNRPEAL